MSGWRLRWPLTSRQDDICALAAMVARHDAKLAAILGTMQEAADVVGIKPPDFGPRLTLCEARLDGYDTALSILAGPIVERESRKAKRGHLRLVPDQAAQ